MASPSAFLEPPLYARYQPFVLLVTAFAAGIFFDRQWPIAVTTWWLAFSAAVALWLLVWHRGWDIAASCILMSAMMATGGAWHHYCWHLVDSDHIVTAIREESQPICVEAYVVSSPRIIPAPPATPLRTIPIGDRSRCELMIRAVRDGIHWRRSSGRARLLVEGHVRHIKAGDTVHVYALYSRPTPALNPGEFDFANFERSEGRWCNLAAETPACVVVSQAAAWWDVYRVLDSLRLNGNVQLHRFISPHRAALASAIMLGEREYLDADRNERFLVTGTVHLLAISGVNLGILVYVVWFLGPLGRLSRRQTLAAAIGFAILYALLTDAQPPVVRAAVLITVYCIARWTGHLVSPLHILATAALVVLGINPAWLFHVGAQLSFLAVAVLMWLQPVLSLCGPTDPLDRLILNSRPWSWRAGRRVLLLCWQVVGSSALIWLLSFPLVWHSYNLISPVAVGLNPLVWLPMGCALFSGFAVLVLGWILPPVGTTCGAICDQSLGLMEQLIAATEPYSAGYYWLPAPPAWWVAVFYAALALAACTPMFRPRFIWWCALGVGWTAIAIYLAMPIRSVNQKDSLTVTFVAVGHGAAILVELPDGRNLLYDAGRLGSPLTGARPIAAVLWSRGITHLDAVVISHADSDHYNALPELLERFSVGKVYVSTVMWSEGAPGPMTLREAIDRHGVPIEVLRAGDFLGSTSSSPTRLEVLHPPRGGVLGSDNANSIVLLIEHAGRRVLLTGDLEARGMADLLAEPAVDCDLLMAPHHGSVRSNPRGLAQWCRPEHVVISGSRDFELGRDDEVVAKSFYAAGANVYHTAQHGSVRFIFSRDDLAASPYRVPPERGENSVYSLATKAR